MSHFVDDNFDNSIFDDGHYWVLASEINTHNVHFKRNNIKLLPATRFDHDDKKLIMWTLIKKHLYLFQISELMKIIIIIIEKFRKFPASQKMYMSIFQIINKFYLTILDIWSKHLILREWESVMYLRDAFCHQNRKK